MVIGRIYSLKHVILPQDTLEELLVILFLAHPALFVYRYTDLSKPLLDRRFSGVYCLGLVWGKQSGSPICSFGFLCHPNLVYGSLVSILLGCLANQEWLLVERTTGPRKVGGRRWYENCL